MRQLDDALVGFLKIGTDFLFDARFRLLVERCHVHIREIRSAHLGEIRFHVAQKIDLLECSAQSLGVRLQSLVLGLVAVDKDLQAHQAHHFSRSHDVFLKSAAVVIELVQVPFHATQEQIHVLFVEVVRVIHLLEGVQNRVEADFVVQGILGVLLESLEQHSLLGVVKGVDDFVSKTHEAVNGINGLTKRRSQEPDAHGKRSAVRLRG